MGKKRLKSRSSNQKDDSDDEGASKRSRLNEDKENSNELGMTLQSFQAPQRPVSMKNFEAKLEANLRSGKIKKINLQNFMCHANFEVKFNKCINIIVGLNGSGKSAILTAISIGLGAKAASTARSTNLKELVRRGETSATIEITLANDGHDTYEHDVFGDEIIIVRSINSNTGASTYKLKNQHGRIISTSRQELMKLLLCLNIQVENPVLILNQDAARSFLKECDPKKFYQFFMKATQIETIIVKLNSCFQSAVASKNKLSSFEKLVQKYESEIEIISQKYSRLQSVKLLREKIENHQNELDWLKVNEVETELKNEEETLNNKRTDVCRITDLINNKKKYEKENREKIRELGTTFEQLTFEVESNNARYDESRKNFDTERDKLSEFENTFKSNNDRLLKKIIPNILQIEQDITEHENNPLNVDKMRLENEAKINEVQRKILENAGILANSKQDFQMFLQTLNEEKEAAEEIKNQIRREQDNITKIYANIERYKNSGRNTLSIYGQSAGRLLKELEVLYKQKKFTQLPKAFLGRYIEVRDKKYRQAVETILRNQLTSFIVNCDKDRILLADVLKKYPDLQNSQIITTEFVQDVYNVRQGSVVLKSGSGVVLINIIKVKDPVVMNCLIDQCRIEKIVLVEDTDSAIELTQDERSVPKNLSRVVQLKPLSDFYPAPNYRTYSIREQPLRYIQTNFTEVIHQLQNERHTLEGKCEALNSRFQEIVKKIQEFQKYADDKKKLMNDLQQKEKKYQRELNQLRQVEFPENTDIECLKHQLEEDKKLKMLFEKKIEQSKQKFDQQKIIVERYRQAMADQLVMTRQSQDKMRQVQLEVESLQKNFTNMKNEMERIGRQIDTLQEEVNLIEINVMKLKRKVEEMIAKTKGSRVPCTHTKEKLENSIKMIERRIQGIESSSENIEDVEQQLSHKREQLENTRSIRNAFENLLKQLASSRENRFMYVRKLRQHMTLRMKHKFHQLMQIRKYSAEIDIDHKIQTLKLKIIPRDGEVEGAVSNTKSLSGGERSYSTVAFLLSLWSCVDHPFYFLDEYDVFSDEYNRHMMTKLLLNEADKKKDRQFGFLTPQEFSNVQSSDTITIHKLQDPERRN